MAFPRYLSRIEDSLMQALPGASRDVLLRTLEDCLVEVHLDPDLTVANDLMIRTLARLYPALSFEGPQQVCAEAESVAQTVNPRIEFCRARAITRVSVHVGDADADVRIGVKDWSVGRAVMRDGKPAQPGAQAVAAALAMGGLFTRVFGMQGTTKPYGPDEWWVLPEGTKLPSEVRDPIHLAGAGAIGQAFIWMLKHQPSGGRLVVIDPESVTEPNLQRYVLSDPRHVGRLKVEVVQSELTGAGWVVDPISRTWGDYFPTTDGRIERVATALDTVRDRLGVQAGLPHSITNAWTQARDIGVTVHEHFGVTPCVGCLYSPSRGLADYERVAAAFGLDKHKVLAYWQLPVPISECLDPSVVASLAQANKPIDPGLATTSLFDDLTKRVPAAKIAQWAGNQLTDLYTDGMCGGALLSFANDPGSVAHVPVAHQSVLAGVLLALATLARGARIAWPQESRIETLHSGLPSFPPSALRQRCFCQDIHYVERWRAKWQ